MNINSNADNKLFWRTVFTCFIEKNVSRNSMITLTKKEKTVTDSDKIVDTLNNFIVILLKH